MPSQSEPHLPGVAGTDDAGTPQSPAAPEATPVGDYANRLKSEFNRMDRVMITGELADVRRTRVQVYFQLRDSRGGVPCAMWKNDFDKLGLPEGSMKDGAQVIVRGGPDYYAGGPNASPAFSFRVTALRLAGEGDLLARLAALRRKFDAEGLLDRQKLLKIPALPKTIGVITAEGGAARQDILAGFERRGWRGTVIWGFAPVQDRNAAPAITRALSGLAIRPEVEAIVVCRGGGSLTDLWAFCDEDLCRTVAMLAVPVISAIGHERDVTLIDDVSAVRASTPTHAAEAAIGIDCNHARTRMLAAATGIESSALYAIRTRVGPLSARAGAPARAVRIQRVALNQRTREIRAAAARGVVAREVALRNSTVRGLVPAAGRRRRHLASEVAENALLPARLTGPVEKLLARDGQKLDAQALATRAHDPQRTLERGYARIEDSKGEAVTSKKDAIRANRLDIHFADGDVGAEVKGSAPRKRRRTKVAPEDLGQIRLKGVDGDE